MPEYELALDPFAGHPFFASVKPVVEGACDGKRTSVPSLIFCQRQVWHMGPGILEVFIVSFAPLQSCVLRIIEQNSDMPLHQITGRYSPAPTMKSDHQGLSGPGSLQQTKQSPEHDADNGDKAVIRSHAFLNFHFQGRGAVWDILQAWPDRWDSFTK